ncbi:MAG: hypothetical protein V1835_00855 [Candidatus Micrarchaeota archaeon]
MPFSEVINHTFEAYKKNFKLLTFFAFPFAIVFGLSLLLQNFVSLSGIFLRYGSIQTDLTAWDAFIIVAVFLLSLLFFSFAIVAINLVIKSQRTLKRLTFYEHEKIEANVARMFTIFLAVFVLILVINMLLYDLQLTPSLGLFLSLVISLAVLFVPQALVIDDLGMVASIYMSISVLFRRFPYLLAYLVIASVLITANTQLFLEIGGSAAIWRYVAVLVNALIILPFLEVLKTQIYLSKYTVLKSA